MNLDYILLSAIFPAGWNNEIAAAEAAGIPVIITDRPFTGSSYTAFVTSDLAKEGELAVDWLLDQGLSAVNVFHIQGELGTPAQIARSSALETAVKEGQLNVVKQQSGYWSGDEAQQIVREAISKGLSFNVIYVENNSMAVGAIHALDEAGITHGVGGDVIIISFNADKWALEELLAGKWNYIVQSSPFQAGIIHEIIQNLENGIKPTEKVVYVPAWGFDAKTITKADIDIYGY